MPIFFPPPNQTGGRQPHEGKLKLVQGRIPDNPPFGPLNTIIDFWVQQPQPQQRRASLIQGLFAPLGRMLVTAATTIAVSSYAAAAMPQMPGKLNPALMGPTTQVDNPPVVSSAAMQANIVQQHQPPFPPVITVYVTLQEAPVVVAQVDNPPKWRPPPDQSIWYIPPPLPTLPVKFSPPSVDSPVGDRMDDLVAIPLFKGLPQEKSKLNPKLLDNFSVQTPPSDNPPFGHVDTIFDWWLPQFRLPQVNKKLPQTAVDSPVGDPLGDIVAIKQFFGLPQQKNKLDPSILNNPPAPPAQVDNPPFGHVDTLFEWWIPEFRLPPKPPSLIQEGETTPVVPPTRRVVGRVKHPKSERFSDAYYRELFGLEEAVDAAEVKADDAKSAKPALKEAVNAVEEAISEASEREAREADLRSIRRALEAAVSARKASDTIAKANLAAHLARLTIEHLEQEAQEEEEAITLLLLY